LAASEVVIYSALIIELAPISHLEGFLLSAPPMRKNTKPDCDLLSSLLVWKLASI
jgi:hypothetical protein